MKNKLTLNCFLIIAVICAVSAVFQGCARKKGYVQSHGAAEQIPTAQAGDGKILVAFFSWSGNAKMLAGQIAEETGADLFEIKAAAPYPDTYREAVKAARRELKSNARPDLSGSVADMAQYSTVFLCYPNWWGTMPMPVLTFLESYDFSGKVMFPLVTHGGSRFGRSLNDIRKTVPELLIGEGLSVSAMDRNPNDDPVIGAPLQEISSWLQRLGMSVK